MAGLWGEIRGEQGGFPGAESELQNPLGPDRKAETQGHGRILYFEFRQAIC